MARSPDEPARRVAGGLQTVREEPGTLWIRNRPRVWPGPEAPWTDWSRRGVGSTASAEPSGDGLRRFAEVDFEGRLYLPPVDDERSAERDGLLRAVGATAEVLVQRLPGEAGAGALDLLPWLLADPKAPPAGELVTETETAVWPLVAGVSDRAAIWSASFPLIRAAGVTTLLPMTLTLDAHARRRLAADVDDAGYQSLFHGEPPDERPFARAAATAGFNVFAPLPATTGPRRHRFARRAALELTRTADLWLRLGRSEVAGQELARAARYCDAEDYDLEALCREGNLAIVPWLSGEARAVIESLAEGRTPPLVEELRQAWCASEAEA